MRVYPFGVAIWALILAIGTSSAQGAGPKFPCLTPVKQIQSFFNGPLEVNEWSVAHIPDGSIWLVRRESQIPNLESLYLHTSLTMNQEPLFQGLARKLREHGGIKLPRDKVGWILETNTEQNGNQIFQFIDMERLSKLPARSVQLPLKNLFDDYLQFVETQYHDRVNFSDESLRALGLKSSDEFYRKLSQGSRDLRDRSFLAVRTEQGYVNRGFGVTDPIDPLPQSFNFHSGIITVQSKAANEKLPIELLIPGFKVPRRPGETAAEVTRFVVSRTADAETSPRTILTLASMLKSNTSIDRLYITASGVRPRLFAKFGFKTTTQIPALPDTFLMEAKVDDLVKMIDRELETTLAPLEITRFVAPGTQQPVLKLRLKINSIITSPTLPASEKIERYFTILRQQFPKAQFDLNAKELERFQFAIQESRTDKRYWNSTSRRNVDLTFRKYTNQLLKRTTGISKAELNSIEDIWGIGRWDDPAWRISIQNVEEQIERARLTGSPVAHKKIAEIMRNHPYFYGQLYGESGIQLATTYLLNPKYKHVGIRSMLYEVNELLGF